MFRKCGGRGNNIVGFHGLGSMAPGGPAAKLCKKKGPPRARRWEFAECSCEPSTTLSSKYRNHKSMALNPSPSTASATYRALRQCEAPARSVARRLGPPARQLSTSAPRNNEPTETAVEQERRPRWSYTPERMKGPGFSINIVKDPRRTIWHNNEDPAKLDVMYNRLLGSKGHKMLPDETKWLAVTHKSFDQGRRGFNTRLAYFGTFISTAGECDQSLDDATKEREGKEGFKEQIY